MVTFHSIHALLSAGELEFAAGIVSEYVSTEWIARLCESAGLLQLCVCDMSFFRIRNILNTAPAPPVARTPVPTRDELLPNEETQKV